MTLPLPGPAKVSCPCGCGQFGTPKKRNGHVSRTCPCRSCKAPGYKRRASGRERQIAREKGGEREPLSGALSGADVRGPGWCAEETSEKRVAGPVHTAWNRKMPRMLERQRRFGEVPFLVVTAEKPWLVVMRYEDWQP